MIKESFLRNYSLCKIYSEAEDQKRKLKVFYVRHVQKILREKHMKEREVEREKKNREIQEERDKERQKAQQSQSIRRSPKRQAHNMISNPGEEMQNSKKKAQLRVTYLKFHKKTEQNDTLSPNMRKDWRIKTSLNKSFHKNMTNSFANTNNTTFSINSLGKTYQNQEKKYVQALIETNPSFSEDFKPLDKKLRSLHQEWAVVSHKKKQQMTTIGESTYFERKKLEQNQNSFINHSTINKVFLRKLRNTGLLDSTKTEVNTPLCPKML